MLRLGFHSQAYFFRNTGSEIPEVKLNYSYKLQKVHID